jgi:predicted TIM-barrel fold metal-dependent hydrolase
LIAEVTNDTARAITNLLFKGALRRFRDIRFIFCHGGGPIPMIWGRMAGQATPEERQYFPEGADVELKRLYYDIAGTAYKPALAALTTMLPTSQILFGSDNPFVPLPETAEGLPKLGLPEKTLRAIRRENALHLIPRLA